MCVPETTQCADTLETCSESGLEWVSTPCEEGELCDSCAEEDEMGGCTAACFDPCAQASGSTGCSFYTTGLLQSSLPQGVSSTKDGIVVVNPDPEYTAVVELNWIQAFLPDETFENTVTLAPGESHTFELGSGLTSTMDEGPANTSLRLAGGIYHIVSDFPVGAHLHSPAVSLNSNASTMLVPDRALGTSHVIANHGAWVEPNYFVVIAIEDDTTVTWQPTVETNGDDLSLPYVDQGQTGEVTIDRYDNLRIETSAYMFLARPKCEQDLSGSLVTADKPIWVLSAIRGLRLPWCGSSMVEGCMTIIDNACDSGSDFAFEQNLPLDHWGTQYVGAHAPVRGTESHYWRVYAGADDVMVMTDPPQPGMPIELASVGDWQELVLPAGTNVMFESEKPFMPVQYISGHYDAGNNVGSPEMIQGIPTDRFLDRYVFRTPSDYEQHFAQITRATGGAEISIDDAPVTEWESIGAWEVANVVVDEGPHLVTSSEVFGLGQYGYSLHEGSNHNSAGYAYVVGLDLN